MADNIKDINENEATSKQPVEANATAKVMKAKDLNTVSKKQTAMKVLVQIALYTFLGIMALFMLFPFYWMLISSIKTVEEYNATVPTFWPHQFQWSNYRAVFTDKDLNLLQLFWNTVKVGLISTVLSLVVTVLSAYAFAKFDFKGKNLMFGFMLATMMIPGELFTITNYVTVADFGWLDHMVVLIVPFLVSVFYIYLLRQNFLQIPNELYLAAKVDGTSDLKYLWKVMIPLSSSTLISITILKMMGSWNSYVWPRLVARADHVKLITVGLRQHQFTDEVTRFLIDYPKQMAAVFLVTIPLLLVFIFLRKYIMRGVSRSGIKG